MAGLIFTFLRTSLDCLNGLRDLLLVPVKDPLYNVNSMTSTLKCITVERNRFKEH